MTTIKDLSLVSLSMLTACIFGSEGESGLERHDDVPVQGGLLDGLEADDDLDLPSTGCPVNETPLECRVFDLVNEERALVGLAPYVYSDRLAQAAHDHALDMSVNDYYDHVSLDGRTVQDRIEAAGYVGRAFAENIHRGQLTPEDAMEGWMNSSGHRGNILHGQLEEIGVGYAEVGHFWVQNFGTPM